MSKKKPKADYVLWTDGCAAPTNPGPGGWAYVAVNGTSQAEASGNERWSTNNRMELMAVIKGLEDLPAGSVVTICADSSYVINGAKSWMKAWRKRDWTTVAGTPVLNKDLWVRLDAALQRHKQVTWKKVRGHSGVLLNERCDLLAGTAARMVTA